MKKEQNYFKTKLEISKETLVMAESKVEHLDIQLKLLGERFEHDKKVYEDQIVHMQDTITEMKKRIPQLEKKIEQGYTHVDLKTGKAFKSFEAIHAEQLKEKISEALDNQKASEENYKRKQALKEKRNLKPEEQEIVEVEKIRESLQGADEIAEIHVKEQEALRQKIEQYRLELEELKKPIPVEPEVNFDTVGNEMSELDAMDEEAIHAEQIAIVKEHKENVNGQLAELEAGKVQCPECGEFFTKGGAFKNHFKTHLNGD